MRGPVRLFALTLCYLTPWLLRNKLCWICAYLTLQPDRFILGKINNLEQSMLNATRSSTWNIRGDQHKAQNISGQPDTWATFILFIIIICKTEVVRWVFEVVTGFCCCLEQKDLTIITSTDPGILIYMYIFVILLLSSIPSSVSITI